MNAKSTPRPDIEKISNGIELRKWYWLKTELTAEARRLGVKCSGAKFTILDRLCHFHATGNPVWPGDKATENSSKFDWHSNKLSTDTIITDNYKNTQNVRRFFQAHTNPKFKFNISMMEWIKNNVGATLGDAAFYWQEQVIKGEQTKIKPHNQLNQYFRDFMDDNPSLGIKDARKAWAAKKQLPSESGRHQYERADLKFLKVC